MKRCLLCLVLLLVGCGLLTGCNEAAGPQVAELAEPQVLQLDELMELPEQSLFWIEPIFCQAVIICFMAIMCCRRGGRGYCFAWLLELS